MSRHHHRFERDYRGPWERRDIRPSGLHNGGANHSCASAVVNGNNRPGLLPLPVIPSLLPIPATVAVTTSSGDIAVKRCIAAAGSVAPASAKFSKRFCPVQLPGMPVFMVQLPQPFKPLHSPSVPLSLSVLPPAPFNLIPSPLLLHSPHPGFACYLAVSSVTFLVSQWGLHSNSRGDGNGKAGSSARQLSYESGSKLTA
ncbi:unnamed protein product [Pleuronectes platessa]|uniref:Uncharacterized protein n=1 Tax=Pleuronectes platessa TaxID=8262 RepID=A0A9N7Z033_PLEPL|nr:unnamed protein product [Pleuronectes platessa]